MPYPKTDGTLPCIIVTEILATKDTTEAHDPEAINVQLARRDLNVVPNLLHCKSFIKQVLTTSF